MTHADIETILDTPYESRTPEQQGALTRAMRREFRGLSRGSVSLLCAVRHEGQAVKRVPGTDRFTITSRVHRGRKTVREFRNADLRPLIQRELLTCAGLGNGIGLIEATKVGRWGWLHTN